MTPQGSPIPQHWIQPPLQSSWDDLLDFTLDSFGIPKEQLGDGYSSFASVYATLQHYEAIEEARRRMLARAF